MYMHPFLLCLSEDPALLETRSRVLATRYSVVPVSSLGELEALPVSSAFQILVICHSVPKTECEMAIRVSHARWPDIKVVSMTRSEHDEPTCEENATVASSRGPLALLDCVFRLSQQ